VGGSKSPPLSYHTEGKGGTTGLKVQSTTAIKASIWAIEKAINYDQDLYMMQKAYILICYNIQKENKQYL